MSTAPDAPATRTLADQARALGARAQLLVLAIDEWSRGVGGPDAVDTAVHDVVDSIDAWELGYDAMLEAQAEEDDRRAKDAN